MFINPKTAIENGWITFPSWMTEEQQTKCIQPNAIDFTLDRVFAPNNHTFFSIDENQKTMKKFVEIAPQLHENNPHLAPAFIFKPQSHYDCMSDFHVKIPEHVAAMLIVRSTLNRNGLFITSGLYDSGFENYIGFMIHNRSITDAFISPGTRVGQIIFVQASSAHLYDGSYNDQKGNHWTKISP